MACGAAGGCLFPLTPTLSPHSGWRGVVRGTRFEGEGEFSGDFDDLAFVGSAWAMGSRLGDWMAPAARECEQGHAPGPEICGWFVM